MHHVLFLEAIGHGCSVPARQHGHSSWSSPAAPFQAPALCIRPMVAYRVNSSRVNGQVSSPAEHSTAGLKRCIRPEHDLGRRVQHGANGRRAQTRQAMVAAVRRGASRRAVACLFRVSIATVHLWVQSADDQCLDRVDWTDRPPIPRTLQRPYRATSGVAPRSGGSGIGSERVSGPAVGGP